MRWLVGGGNRVGSIRLLWLLVVDRKQGSSCIGPRGSICVSVVVCKVLRELQSGFEVVVVLDSHHRI